MMRLTRMKDLFSVACLLVVAAVMAACSGGGGGAAGGGGGGGGGGVTSISGAVTFPTVANVLSKRTAATVTDSTVTVEVHTLDGALVKAVNPTYDDTLGLDQRVFSYSVSDLPPGVDYIIKVKRGSQILKKLIDKNTVVTGSIIANINAVTTAAVVIASQNLSTAAVKINLGEPLPAGSSAADLSTKIVALKPVQLEAAITTAVTGDRSGLTTQEAVNLANVYNLVVVAVSTATVGSVDSVLNGSSTLTNVPRFSFTAGVTPVATLVNYSKDDAAALLIGTALGYSPPATDPAVAVVYVQQAKDFLAKQDIANANNSYELALASDPDNLDANTGGAITTGLMLLDDPDFKATAARWDVVYPSVTQVVQGTSPIKLPFGNLTSVRVQLKTAKVAAAQAVAPAAASRMLASLKALKAVMPQQKAGFKSLAKDVGSVPTTAPSVSEMQTLIDNVIVPRIDKMLARLAKIEGKTSNGFTVTKAMQGNSFGNDVVLGDGEYYALDAALNLVQVLCKVATSYNFDVPAAYSYNTIAQDPLAMINDAKVFTLKTGGSAKMTAALANAQSAAAKTKLGFDIINIRAAGVGALDFANWAASDKTQFIKTLAEVTLALNGPSTITVKAKQIAVDFTQFFKNPLDRKILPNFNYDVPRDAALSAKYGKAVAAEHIATAANAAWTTDCSLEPISDLPDYTVNGILPGNTAANNVAEFNGILPMLSGKLLIDSNGFADPYFSEFTTDGTYIYAYSYFSNAIKKINPTTGDVSDYATAAPGYSGIARLLWYNGNFYSANMSSQLINPTLDAYKLELSLVTITSGSYTVGSPIAVASGEVAVTSTNPWVDISALTSVGTNLYYGVSTWDQTAGNNSTNIRKLSNLSADASLFNISDWVDTLGVSGSFIYADGDKYNLVSPNAPVASYANAHGGILVGGYFYRIHNGKIVKFAGTPAGGVAKPVVSRF